MFGPKKRGPKPETFLLKVSVCIYFWVFRFIRLSFRGVASCAHRLNHFSDVCTPINFDATVLWFQFFENNCKFEKMSPKISFLKGFWSCNVGQRTLHDFTCEY